MSDLDGKRVLVTGAADGMGRAIAAEAARQGAAAVTITDRPGTGLDDTRDLVAEAGAAVTALPADLRSSDDIARLVSDAASSMGGLDSLVNNAGVIDTALQDGAGLLTMEESTWDTVMAVNLKSVWLLTRAAAPHLLSSDRGPSIASSASVSGVYGTRSAVAYGASKAGLMHLTKSTAVALAPTVRANAFLPGTIDSPMSRAHLDASPDPERTVRTMTGSHLLPRLGDCDEVARVACFLISDSASFVTGAIVPVDGGSLAWRGLRD